MQIFPNGSFFYSNHGGPDIDLAGLPIPAPEPLGPISCTITTATDNRQGRYDDGSYRQQSYSVTLNYEDAPSGFNPASVTLTHERHGILGTFTVQRIEYYDLTQTIELWV